jgi:thymidylate synthase (FAD)
VFNCTNAFNITEGIWGKEDGATTGQSLAEFAGRACYESWNRPNPKTAANSDYIRHIIDVGHWSVLEHASFTVYVEGVSRSLTHELVRHRHFSYSQLSQRYVDETDADFVVPPAIVDDHWEGRKQSAEHILEACDNITKGYYKALVDMYSQDRSRKRAREIARAVLPNMTETRIVVTGNFRAWSHFFDMRMSDGADREIYELAKRIYAVGMTLAPEIFPEEKLKLA